MSRRPKWTLLFAPEAIEHLDEIDRKYHSLVRRAIDEQLGFTPETATRNRKALEQPAPFGATWELRCGPGNRFRIFSEVDSAEQSVWILAIGRKEGNRLLIGGEEFRS